jgi:hypothetical protein
VNAADLKTGIIVRGPMLPEPVEVLVIAPLGDAVKLTGAGQKTGQVHQRVLSPDQIALLEATPETEPFDGDPRRMSTTARSMVRTLTAVPRSLRSRWTTTALPPAGPSYSVRASWRASSVSRRAGSR